MKSEQEEKTLINLKQQEGKRRRTQRELDRKK